MKAEQSGNIVTVTMTREEWTWFSAMKGELDTIHQGYFARGKTPGVFEATGIWNRLMETWGAFRRAQGL